MPGKVSEAPIAANNQLDIQANALDIHEHSELTVVGSFVQPE